MLHQLSAEPHVPLLSLGGWENEGEGRGEEREREKYKVKRREAEQERRRGGSTLAHPGSMAKAESSGIMIRWTNSGVKRSPQNFRKLQIAGIQETHTVNSRADTVNPEMLDS